MSKYEKPGDVLDMLGEEGAEIAQEVFKARRFGLDTKYMKPVGRIDDQRYAVTTPRMRLLQEVGDLLAVLEIAVEQRVFTADEVMAAVATKHDRLEDLFGLRRPRKSLGWEPGERP
jgi:hypothetical protein